MKDKILGVFVVVLAWLITLFISYPMLIIIYIYVRKENFKKMVQIFDWYLKHVQMPFHRLMLKLMSIADNKTIFREAIKQLQTQRIESEQCLNKFCYENNIY